ncbi:MAG: ATP-binding protein [Enterocloster bolteae]
MDGSDPLIIQADKRLFAKVLSNLISNACHYSPAGEEIRIQIAKADDAVGFSIENTGVHIPEEEIPGLFEPFTRGSRHVARETGGSGLGAFYCADGAGAASFFLTGWKIQTTASDLVLYLPCREICRYLPLP